jgi:predicted negative regulator of RcsB-dependent stress response
MSASAISSNGSSSQVAMIEHQIASLQRTIRNATDPPVRSTDKQRLAKEQLQLKEAESASSGDEETAAPTPATTSGGHVDVHV